MTKRGRPEERPFSTLEVGDSFSIKDGENIISLYWACAKQKQRTGKEFVIDQEKQEVRRIT